MSESSDSLERALGQRQIGIPDVSMEALFGGAPFVGEPPLLKNTDDLSKMFKTDYKPRFRVFRLTDETQRGEFEAALARVCKGEWLKEKMEIYRDSGGNWEAMLLYIEVYITKRKNDDAQR